MILTYLRARPLNAALVSLPLQTAAADDESYWSTLLPGAAEKHEREAAALRAPVILAPRQRKQVDYTGKLGGKVAASQQQWDSQGGDTDFVPTAGDGEDDDDDVVLPKVSLCEGAA